MFKMTVNGIILAILNAQYVRNLTIVFLVKMEYVPKIDIFGLKMLVKSGLEKKYSSILQYS